jgi:hypothetical protein
VAPSIPAGGKQNQISPSRALRPGNSFTRQSIESRCSCPTSKVIAAKMNRIDLARASHSPPSAFFTHLPALPPITCHLLLRPILCIGRTAYEDSIRTFCVGVRSSPWRLRRAAIDDR